MKDLRCRPSVRALPVSASRTGRLYGRGTEGHRGVALAEWGAGPRRRLVTRMPGVPHCFTGDCKLRAATAEGGCVYRGRHAGALRARPQQAAWEAVHSGISFGFSSPPGLGSNLCSTFFLRMNRTRAGAAERARDWMAFATFERRMLDAL